jgi:hypothetical protein
MGDLLAIVSTEILRVIAEKIKRILRVIAEKIKRILRVNFAE